MLAAPTGAPASRAILTLPGNTATSVAAGAPGSGPLRRRLATASACEPGGADRADGRALGRRPSAWRPGLGLRTIMTGESGRACAGNGPVRGAATRARLESPGQGRVAAIYRPLSPPAATAPAAGRTTKLSSAAPSQRLPTGSPSRPGPYRDLGCGPTGARPAVARPATRPARRSCPGAGPGPPGGPHAKGFGASRSHSAILTAPTTGGSADPSRQLGGGSGPADVHSRAGERLELRGWPTHHHDAARRVGTVAGSGTRPAGSCRVHGGLRGRRPRRGGRPPLIAEGSSPTEG